MDLHVSRKPILNLLSENEFVIPEYQREYDWDEDKCDILWEDLTQSYRENRGNEERDYFLGTIVCYKDKDKEDKREALHVVDGQQRITTFMLLLKAIYRKLERMRQDNLATEDEIRGLQSQIAKCIWNVDRITQKPSFNNPRIETRVFTKPKYNDYLQKVLSNYDLEKKDNEPNVDYDQCKYVKNYKFLIKKVDDLPGEDLRVSGNLFEFIVSLLESCVLLPITCTDFEMGLKIFQTLNDRGMPLSDADIFKQQLYKSYTNDEDRKNFIDEWSKINELCTYGANKIAIIDIFRYYMHIIRAEKERKDNLKGLRPFYLKDNKQYLSDKKEKLMTDIENQAMTWSAIHNEFPEHHYPERFKDVDEASKKYLQILSAYSNEWWRFVVSVLWHKCDGRQLHNPLRKITAALYFQFLKTPTLAKIKPIVFRMNNNIFHDRKVLHDVFKPEDIREEAIKDVVTNFIEERTAGKVVKGLLALYAYLDKHQKPIQRISDYQIEHILPQKWQDKNYNGWTKEDAKTYIESIGNKVLFEQKLNIQAGNGYFNNKKDRYKNSQVHELRSLSEKQEQKDWLPSDIEKREKDMTDTFIQFFRDEFHS